MWVWGDLHQLGVSYIFNAVLNPKGETAWNLSTIPPDRKTINCESENFFERRGVIVAAIGDCSFNLAASDYLGLNAK